MRRAAVLLVSLCTAVLLTAPLHAAVLMVTILDPTTENTYHEVSADRRDAVFPAIGDIVTVMPDDWTLEDSRFGTKECRNFPPKDGGKLICIELRDIAYQQAIGMKLISSVVEIPADGPPTVKVYRRFRVLWEQLPENTRIQIHNNGAASFSYNDFKGFILDKGGVR